MELLVESRKNGREKMCRGIQILGKPSKPTEKARVD